MTRRTETKAVINLFDTTAKQDGEYIVNDALPICNISKLDDKDYSTTKYATLEDNGFFLDGTYSLMSDKTTSNELCYWSHAMSDEDGAFDDTIKIERSFTGNHSSAGLTLYFDDNYSLPKKIHVAFGKTRNEIIEEKDFVVDKYEYFCSCSVENYKYISITFKEVLPYQYARLKAVEYGVILEYSSNSIKKLSKANLLEELDITSSEVSVNTSSITVIDQDEAFSISNPKGYYSLLQKRQKIEIYEIVDGVPYQMATHYIKSWETTSGAISTFKNQDILGIMDNANFKGNLYFGTKASVIIDEIMQSFGWTDYYINDEIGKIVLSGAIAPCTHREALQQVVFACCGLIDTSRVSGINIYKGSHTVQTTILSNRKFLSPTHSIKQNDLITDVEVMVCNYSKSADLKQAYKSTLNEGIYEIGLKKPYSGYVAENCEIISSGYYYLNIKVNKEAEVIIKGYEWENNQTVYTKSMEDLPSGASRNVKQVKNATLVSKTNAMDVAENLYTYYQYRLNHELKIVCEDEKVGNYAGVKSDGNLIALVPKSLDIDLTGGFLATVKGIGYALKIGDYDYTGERYTGEEMGVI